MKNFEEYIIETLKSHPEKAALEESKQKLKNRLKEEAVHFYRPQKFSYKFRYGLLTAITFFLFLFLLWGDGVGQLQKGIEGFFSQGKEETRNKEDSSPLYIGEYSYRHQIENLLKKNRIYHRAWSQDNQKVIFVEPITSKRGNLSIWTVGENKPVKVKELKNYEMIDFLWSPNSQYVIISNGADPYYQLEILSLNTLEIIETFTTIANPVWSPDSLKIAFGKLNEAVKMPEESGLTGTFDLAVYNIEKRKTDILLSGTSEYFYLAEIWDQPFLLKYRKFSFGEIEDELGEVNPIVALLEGDEGFNRLQVLEKKLKDYGNNLGDIERIRYNNSLQQLYTYLVSLYTEEESLLNHAYLNYNVSFLEQYRAYKENVNFSSLEVLEIDLKEQEVRFVLQYMNKATHETAQLEYQILGYELNDLSIFPVNSKN